VLQVLELGASLLASLLQSGVDNAVHTYYSRPWSVCCDVTVTTLETLMLVLNSLLGALVAVPNSRSCTGALMALRSPPSKEAPKGLLCHRQQKLFGAANQPRGSSGTPQLPDIDSLALGHGGLVPDTEVDGEEQGDVYAAFVGILLCFVCWCRGDVI
jgi:hypothetical protein